MNPHQWPGPPARPAAAQATSPPLHSSARAPSPPAPSGRTPASADWKAWLRSLERKRRAVERDAESAGRPTLPRAYLARVTRASFLLDGIDLPDREAADMLTRGPGRRAFRSRQGQRLRNHVAILRQVERVARGNRPLTAGAIVRWYTSVSCGLSSARLGDDAAARLERAARLINAPHLNLRPALEEVARLHHDLLADPVVPGFNGILVRLLLDCHLGRCGLIPPVFDADHAPRAADGPAGTLRHLMRVLQSSYDDLLNAT